MKNSSLVQSEGHLKSEDKVGKAGNDGKIQLDPRVGRASHVKRHLSQGSCNEQKAGGDLASVFDYAKVRRARHSEWKYLEDEGEEGVEEGNDAREQPERIKTIEELTQCLKNNRNSMPMGERDARNADPAVQDPQKPKSSQHKMSAFIYSDSITDHVKDETIDAKEKEIDTIEQFVEILRLTTQVCHVEIYSKELIQLYQDTHGDMRYTLSQKEKRRTRRKLEAFHNEIQEMMNEKEEGSQERPSGAH